MNKPNCKIIYPFVGTVCAAGGTAALLSRGAHPGALLLWIALLFAANVFLAAGMVCGTREETVDIPNPKAGLEGEPQTVTATLRRVPVLSVLLAIGATAAVAAVTHSALDSLLTLFTWGALSYPLARSILGRKPFADAMQTGLISATALTVLGGVVHVFKVAPDHTFRLQYAFDLALNAVKERILPVLREAKEILIAQGVKDPALSGFSPEKFTDLLLEEMLRFLPAFFAVLALAALCLIWWLIKQALKKSDFPVRYMGRPDTFSPSKIVFAMYLVSLLFAVLCEEGSALQALGLNVNSVTSAVLAFGGFSLVLFVINTRAPSRFARIGLSVLTLILGLDSCGYQLLIFAGFLSSDGLRQHLGGGTYR